jgi:hypothetical protein
MDAQDTLGAWIDEECITTDAGARTASGALYERFRAWKETRGERAPSMVRFSGQLEQRFTKHRQAGGVVFTGIALKGSG